MIEPIVDFQLRRVPTSPRHFEHYPIGNGMVMSIQASEDSYCSPKITVSSSDEYTEFEVALFFLGKWYHPHTNDKLCDRPWAAYWPKSDDVGSYVPREEVVNMINDLREYFKATTAGKQTGETHDDQGK